MRSWDRIPEQYRSFGSVEIVQLPTEKLVQKKFDEFDNNL